MAHTLDISSFPKGAYTKVAAALKASESEFSYDKPVFSFDDAGLAALVAAAFVSADGAPIVPAGPPVKWVATSPEGEELQSETCAADCTPVWAYKCCKLRFEVPGLVVTLFDADDRECGSWPESAA